MLKVIQNWREVKVIIEKLATNTARKSLKMTENLSLRYFQMFYIFFVLKTKNCLEDTISLKTKCFKASQGLA